MATSAGSEGTGPGGDHRSDHLVVLLVPAVLVDVEHGLHERRPLRHRQHLVLGEVAPLRREQLDEALDQRGVAGGVVEDDLEERLVAGHDLPLRLEEVLRERAGVARVHRREVQRLDVVGAAVRGDEVVEARAAGDDHPEVGAGALALAVERVEHARRGVGVGAEDLVVVVDEQHDAVAVLDRSAQPALQVERWVLTRAGILLEPDQAPGDERHRRRPRRSTTRAPGR